LPAGCKAEIDTNSWEWPAVFHYLQQHGNVDTTEMYRTFNCGVGMVICVGADDADEALVQLNNSGHLAWKLGQIASGDQEVALLP
jgi:phosphoribosylformylglycinamidine cyclo-ligase